jgi:hypothetical protein
MEIFMEGKSESEREREREKTEGVAALERSESVAGT